MRKIADTCKELTDHIWHNYLPIVIAALATDAPEQREIIASVTYREVEQYMQRETTSPNPVPKPVNAVDFFTWLPRMDEGLDVVMAGGIVDEYIHQWFGCSYRELMTPEKFRGE